jgi:hypothetical protein
MKTSPSLLSFALCSLFGLAACGKSGTEVVTPPANPPANAPQGGSDHGHGTPQPLGALTIGAHTFRVVQLGKIEPGTEGFFELEFDAGKPIPATVRGWVGVESAEGSRKARFGKEGDHGLHAHVEVPKPLPAGSLLWVEIETDGKSERKSIATK